MNSTQTEYSASASERHSDEEHLASSESPKRCEQPPDVITSKDVASTHDVNGMVFASEQSPEVASNKIESTNGSLLEEDENDSQEKDNIINIKDGGVTDGLRNISEKLSAALVNANVKEDLAKLHAEVAEEAIAGWEKAENEVASLKKQLAGLILRNSALEDRVSHLDGALKESVRQLRQTREEQEQNVHDAVLKKTHNLELAKIELESHIIELQSKLEASNASSSSIDLENLEKENKELKHKLLVQSEELEIRTIERDLSAQAAEVASKQHLESINKVARLEAECRRLKRMVNDHKSVTSSSICVESLTDSQSDCGERINAVEIDTSRRSGSEEDKCEPSCSDSWASALIAELDQFKNEKCRQIPSSVVKIDLMDDFLEMERLAALPEPTNESFTKESVVTNQSINGESSIQDEFDIMNHQMLDLKEKLEKAKADKSNMETALVKSKESMEASLLRLQEAEKKLEELQRELENGSKSEQMIEKQLMSMEAEAQSVTAKLHSLEVEFDKEKALSVEIAIKCKELEEELESKKCDEKKLWSIANSYSEIMMKQEDLALAAVKLAECQQTIASLGTQLSSLATIEGFPH